MRILLSVVLLMMTAALARAASGDSAAAPLFFSPVKWEAERAFEREINAIAEKGRLRAWHDMLASEPHVAGTLGDQKVIDAIAAACRDMGLEVQVHEFWALLCQPVDAKLEIVGSHESASVGGGGPGNVPPRPGRHGVVALPITEDNLLNDPFIAHPGLSFGWNAYSGSGDVTGGVVYANYGTKEDFETLKKNGVDCAGKIVLARYGGNFRGYKAKYAEQAGAVGLIIYTDPDDSGYRKGVTYPEGGWANDTCIQRGSVITLDEPGDPLTPGVAATKDAKRLDVNAVDLPHIPVQPIGYRAAQQIMQRMMGKALPEDLIKSWQGGLPCAYRFTGGDELQLRLMVKQNRAITRSANVIATLRGRSMPQQRVMIGSHHDAWGFGAGDPTSGTILVLESARAFSEMAKRGRPPERSIDFCFWGAEEFGVIGSTEYCEQFADDLRQNAVAYINLDGATMGVKFGASSDPLLKTLIEQATREVPQARDPKVTVFEAWLAAERENERSKSGGAASPLTSQPEAEAPSIGTLGGGSDHVGFYCHLGIPSCFISAGGAPGTAYHSNYDNLAWYRHTVGDDYEPALMMTRVVNVMAARLANTEVLPLDPTRYARELREHVKTLQKRAVERNVAIDFARMLASTDRLESSANKAVDAISRALASGEITPAHRSAIEQCTTEVRSAWMSPGPTGLPGRAWFRNLYASSDPQAGYASWALPAVRGAIEAGDAAAAVALLAQCRAIIDGLSTGLEECSAALTGGGAVGASE